MIVIDSSALIELLLATDSGNEIADRIDDADLSLHIPHLADVEVAQVLRRLVRSGELDARRATAAIADLRDLDLERHPHEPLLDRA
jgi:predicted nucleic acid-binding protein